MLGRVVDDLFCCVAGHRDVLDVLLKYGVDVNQQDENGNTPLHHAIANGEMDCVKKILKQKPRLRRNVSGHVPGDSSLFCDTVSEDAAKVWPVDLAQLHACARTEQCCPPQVISEIMNEYTTARQLLREAGELGTSEEEEEEPDLSRVELKRRRLLRSKSAKVREFALASPRICVVCFEHAYLCDKTKATTLAGTVNDATVMRREDGRRLLAAAQVQILEYRAKVTAHEKFIADLGNTSLTFESEDDTPEPPCGGVHEVLDVPRHCTLMQELEKNGLHLTQHLFANPGTSNAGKNPAVFVTWLSYYSNSPCLWFQDMMIVGGPKIAS